MRAVWRARRCSTWTRARDTRSGKYPSSTWPWKVWTAGTPQRRAARRPSVPAFEAWVWTRSGWKARSSRRRAIPDRRSPRGETLRRRPGIETTSRPRRWNRGRRSPSPGSGSPARTRSEWPRRTSSRSEASTWRLGPPSARRVRTRAILKSTSRRAGDGFAGERRRPWRRGDEPASPLLPGARRPRDPSDREPWTPDASRRPAPSRTGSGDRGSGACTTRLRSTARREPGRSSCGPRAPAGRRSSGAPWRRRTPVAPSAGGSPPRG